MDQGLRESDPKKREQFYITAQEILQKEMVRIPLAHAYKTIITQKEIKFEPNALSYIRFKNAQ
jgi:ABC-type transport system substrate-binding protein